MMDWQNTLFEYKLGEWKDFRDEISNLSDVEKLNKTAEFFARLGYGSRTIDYYTPESWPTPWELLDMHSHCKSSISLMMHHTLKFLDVDTKLLLINDGCDDYLIPYHEETDSILNFEVPRVAKLSSSKDITIIS